MTDPLADDAARVARNVANARAARSVSNHSALNGARIAIESICKYILRHEGQSVDERPKLEDLIAKVGKRSPDSVVKDMRVIQLYGNLGSHDAEPAEYQVAAAFNALSAITRWFVDEYLEGSPAIELPSQKAERPPPRLRTDLEELEAIHPLRRDISSLHDQSPGRRPRILAATALGRHVAGRLVERHLGESSRGMALAELSDRLRRHRPPAVPLNILHALETLSEVAAKILRADETDEATAITSTEATAVDDAARLLGDWFEHDYLRYSRWPGRIGRVALGLLLVAVMLLLDRWITGRSPK